MFAVIFDLDGVITDTAPLHFKAWQETCANYDIMVRPEMNSHLKGLSRADSLNMILSFQEDKNKLTVPESEQLLSEKNQTYRQLLQSLTKADLLPGIENLLSLLNKHERPVGLASASKNAPDILHALKIADHFQVIANPQNVKKGKPAPDLFLAAAQGLNVSPGQCIGIEDAKSGIAAIKAAGMIAIGIGEKQELKKADEVLTDTTSLTYLFLQKTWDLYG